MDEEPDGTISAFEQENVDLREQIRYLESSIKTIQAEMREATKWAADYARQHGQFKALPAIPDFMIPF